MPSTYSANLALELPASGEQSGTWGSTTNTNVGTLLEAAISGYITFACTGGADVLTISSGTYNSSGDARNMFIELTTTGGGTVTVPANKKLYFVYNNTASAITFKTSGTGVSIPAAAKMILVCDGTNIVTAVNSVTGSAGTGAFTTLTASGDFAIATNKFTVASASGNTAVAGTLGVTGNFAVNTNRFTVSASAPANSFILDSSGKIGLGGANVSNSPFMILATGVGNDAQVLTNDDGGSAVSILWNKATTNTSFPGFLGFVVDGSVTGVGTVDYNRGGGVVRYLTTSDATLKNIIGDADITSSIDILKNTRLRNYSWKSDTTNHIQMGVIAQELHTVYPGAVSVGHTQPDGTYQPWGADKTAYVWHMVAGWQNHEARLAALEAR